MSVQNLWNFLAPFMAILLVLLLVILAVLLILYILGSVGLVGIAKKLNVKNGWMAWIPIVNFALIAKLAFNNILLQIALPVLLIVSGSYETSVNGEVTSSGSILPAPFNTIASGVFVVLLAVCLYKIYKRMSSKAIIMTVFTILTLGFLAPIFLFAIRRNNVLEAINNNNNTEIASNGSTNNKEQYFEQPIPQQNAQYNEPQQVPIQNPQVNNIPVQQESSASVSTPFVEPSNTIQSSIQSNQM